LGRVKEKKNKKEEHKEGAHKEKVRKTDETENNSM